MRDLDSGLRGRGRAAIVAAGSASVAFVGWPVVILHMVLVYPDGTLERRVERWGLAAVYVNDIVLHGLRYLNEGDARVIGMPETNTTWANVLSAYSLVPTATIAVW